MWKEKSAQPARGGVLCGLQQERIKDRIEKPCKRAYHDQNLKAYDEVEHNGAI